MTSNNFMAHFHTLSDPCGDHVSGPPTYHVNWGQWAHVQTITARMDPIWRARLETIPLVSSMAHMNTCSRPRKSTNEWH